MDLAAVDQGPLTEDISLTALQLNAVLTTGLSNIDHLFVRIH